MSRLTVAVVFFMLGLATGTWAARIPAIKGALHLSAGVLGLALLGPAVGSVLAMSAAGAVLATSAPRRVVQLGLLALGGFLPVTTYATSAWQLFAVLAGWGAGLGVVDVGANIEAAAVQDRLGRSVMAGFHAAYSVGALAGAGIGGLAAAAGVSARADFLVSGAAIVLLGGLSAETFRSRPPATRPAAGERRSPPARWPQWSWALVFLAAMAFSSFMAEGAAGDWSAVYLHSSLGAPVGLAAVGVTVFSATMAGGRIAGDRLIDRLGPARLVRLSAGVGAASFAVALLVGKVWSAMAGFAVLGIGLAVVVPSVFTAASRTGRAGPNLALITASGYLGVLGGPAIIGGLATVAGLPAALGTVVVLCGLIAVLAHFVLPRSATQVGRPPPNETLVTHPGG